MKTLACALCLTFLTSPGLSQDWRVFGTGMNGEVDALLEDSVNAILYAGGSFSAAGGNAIANVAQWDGTSWTALGSGANSVVNDLAMFNGELYAVGSFSSPGNHVARWNGSSWVAVGGGINGSSFALQVLNGALYVGGAFSQAGSVPANNVAMWDGTNWSALGSGVDAVVRTLGVYDGELYVGGDFVNAGGSAANHIAKWDGSAWSPLGTGTDNAVWALQEFGGELFAGGLFNSAGGVTTAVRIAKWDKSNWSAVGSSLNNSVFALAVYDNELYAGGFFELIWATSTPASRIAKWNGSTWSAVGGGVNDGVFALLGTSSALYLGGAFSTADAVTVNNITALGNPLAVGTEDDGGWPTHDQPTVATYPNPFVGSTVLRFELASTQDVEIEVVDLLGRQLRSDALPSRPSGINEYVLDARGWSSGLYFYKVTFADRVSTGTIVVGKR